MTAFSSSPREEIRECWPWNPGCPYDCPVLNNITHLRYKLPSYCLMLWRSRGYLPHFDHPAAVQSITFRLHDAVPEAVVARWRAELAWVEHLPAIDPREVQLRQRIAKYEDAGYGACWLRDERIAALVEAALLHFDLQRYRLLAWCIMPNHIHALIESREGWPLARVVHSWKSYTSHQANKLLGLSGEFWFRDYFDRYIRNTEHLARAIDYIELNPVKARLVDDRKEWRWSSAPKRLRRS